MAKSQEKTEKLQVLISEEDLTDLTRKISKEALSNIEQVMKEELENIKKLNLDV